MATITEEHASATAQPSSWSNLTVRVDDEPSDLLVSRLGDGRSPTWSAVAATPRPLPGAARAVGLRVVLERQPDPDEQAIGHLITGGQLRLDLTTAATAREVASASDALDELVHPLLVEGGRLELLLGGATVASVATSTRGDGHMDATLDADQTRVALDALVTGAPDVTVRAIVGHRAAARTSLVGVDGEWVDLYDALSDDGEQVDRSRLRAVIDRLLTAGTLSLTGTDDHTIAVDLVLAQRAMIFDDVIDGADDERWVLRSRPWPGQRLSYSERRTVGDRHELSISRPLADVRIAGSPDDAIDLVVGTAERARPVRDRDERLRRRSAVASTAGWMNTAAGKQAVATVLKQPVVASPAILTSAVPAILAGHHLTFLDLANAQEASGPLVESASAPAFEDRRDAGTMWWAPGFRLIPDATTANVADDAFRFAVRRVGVDRGGQPVLAATISMTIEPYMTAASERAVASAQRTKRLATDHLVVTLEIPFIDTREPDSTKHHQLVGVVRRVGDRADVTFDVSHDWVRLAYTVLADPTSQSEPAALRIGYSFDGYQPPRRLDLSIFASKLAVTSGLRPLTLRDPSVFAVGRGEVAISVDRVEHLQNVRNGKKLVLAATALGKPTLTGPVATPEKQLVRATFMRRQRVPIETRCATVPNRFVDVTDDPPTTIGCRSSLELGEIAYRMFTQRHDLGEPGVQVFQSTSQPHRFVAVTPFAVGRREPDGGSDDDRPLFVVYAALDPDPSLVRVSFEAVLHPVIRPDQERRLRGRIGREHVDAVLVWPTDLLGATIAFDWLTLDAITEEYTTTVLPEGRVAVAADVDLPQWTVVEAALRHTPPEGTASIVLDDGTRWTVPLHLDPYDAIGPRPGGPITIDIDGDELTLTNRAAAEIAVTGVVGFDENDLVVADEPAAVSLPPGASAVVARPAGVTAEASFTATRSSSADLTEIRAFVEETQTQVLFGLLASLTERDVDSIRVEASLDTVDEAQSVTLTDADNSAEMTFTLPLTQALGERIVRFRLHSIVADDVTATTDWHLHDLSTSALIHLTDDHLD